MGFDQLGLKPQILQSIAKCGFEKPSQIQQVAIPAILDGRDVLAQAQTGTGKTAAFALPILNMLELSDKKEVKVLVMAPTRELAIQVNNEFNNFAKQLGLYSAPVFGGADYSKQLKDIRGASIIVATPGRLIDLLKSKRLSISPDFVILDEADEMLDMGFLDDIKKIFSLLGDVKQKLLFSATMPKAIMALADKILKDPKIIQIVGQDKTNLDITQSFYVVDMRDKKEALVRLFEYKSPEKSIVFCKMKRDVDELVTYLSSAGFNAKGLHGDMAQAQRSSVIAAFRSNKVTTLIATDVAARGLDISDVSHVFNYAIPFDTQSYVHRIGRTGRAGKKGKAISIVTTSEYYLLQKIKKETNSKMDIMQVPSLKELSAKKQSALVEKLKNQIIREDVHHICQELESEFSAEEIAHRVLSFLVDSAQTLRGRDRIGKSIEDILQLEKQGSNNRGAIRGRNSRSGFGGGRSRGGFRDRGRRGSNRGEGRGRSRSRRGGFSDSSFR